MDETPEVPQMKVCGWYLQTKAHPQFVYHLKNYGASTMILTVPSDKYRQIIFPADQWADVCRRDGFVECERPYAPYASTAAHDLLAALVDTLAIARIKWGNLDPDANKVIAAAEAAIAKAEGLDR